MKKSNVFLAMLLTGGLAVAVTAADPFEEKKVYLNSQAGKKAESTGEKVTKGTVHVSTSLNIRTGPWGKIIGSFHEGDALEVLGREGAWYKIRYNGKIAYVHANYVSTPGNPAGKTPVIYPWQQSSSSSGNSGNSTPVVSGNGRFGAMPCAPMPSRASSEYGMRIHPTKGTRSMHYGIDLPVPNGTRLNALGDGTVVAVGYESGGGRYVKVRYDNGYESFYCHLRSYSVKQGQRVGMGQEIARSDNTGIYTTGAHLHFELKKNGQHVNPRSALKLP
ncbi:hypothetical protein MASR1M12_39200 [Erysipelotrichia bacterium]